MLCGGLAISAPATAQSASVPPPGSSGPQNAPSNTDPQNLTAPQDAPASAGAPASSAQPTPPPTSPPTSAGPVAPIPPPPQVVNDAPLPQPPNAPINAPASTPTSASGPTTAITAASPPASTTADANAAVLAPTVVDATDADATDVDAAPAPTTSVAISPADSGARDRGPCLLGPLCVGPMLSLGLPNLIGIGVQVRFTDFLGAAFDYQVMPKISWDSVNAGWSLVTVEGRIHPFGSSFYAAGGVAVQHFFGRGAVEIVDPDNPVHIRGSVTIPSIKLGLGFTGHDGLIIGMDFALLLRLSSTRLSFTAEGGLANNEQVQAETEKIRERGETVLDTLPFLVQFNLLRLGYIF